MQAIHAAGLHHHGNPVWVRYHKIDVQVTSFNHLYVVQCHIINTPNHKCRNPLSIKTLQKYGHLSPSYTYKYMYSKEWSQRTCTIYYAHCTGTIGWDQNLIGDKLFVFLIA